MRGRGGQGGFTLMETMVAVVILALIGGMAYGTLGRALSARDRTTLITDRYHGLRQALTRMSREISMAYLSQNRDCADPRSRTLFLARRASRGARLDFTSFSHHKRRADAKEGDENELSYFIDNDPETPRRRHLMRREQGRIDEYPDSGGSSQVLAEDIDDLEMRFYDSKADNWVDEWDNTGQNTFNRLPKYVALTLQFTDARGKTQKITTKTRIFLPRILWIPGFSQVPCPQ
jgi:general secretion pathway protein J